LARHDAGRPSHSKPCVRDGQPGSANPSSYCEKASACRREASKVASHYIKVVSLAEALDPANIAVYAKRATGEKFLINPNKDK
jgi:hypothetical protein